MFSLWSCRTSNDVVDVPSLNTTYAHQTATNAATRMALIPACIVFEEPLVFPVPAVDPESVAEDVLDVVDADVFEELLVPDVLVGLPMTETTLVRETVAEGTLPVVDRAAGGDIVVVRFGSSWSITLNCALISLSSPSIDTTMRYHGEHPSTQSKTASNSQAIT